MIDPFGVDPHFSPNLCTDSGALRKENGNGDGFRIGEEEARRRRPLPGSEFFVDVSEFWAFWALKILSIWGFN